MSARTLSLSVMDMLLGALTDTYEDGPRLWTARPSKRERRFAEEAKLVLALMRARTAYAPHAEHAEHTLDMLEHSRTHRDAMQAMEDEAVASRAATLRELGSSRQLSRQDRALALAFFNTVAAPSPNRYLRNAAFEVARAESRHERAVERADEAFEAYRFAIVDAVLYWARSHSRPSAAGPRRRQPVRSTRTGPYGAAVADARS